MPPRDLLSGSTFVRWKRAWACVCLALGVFLPALPAQAGFRAALVDVTPDNPYVTVNVTNTDGANSFSYSNAVAGQLNWQAQSQVAGLTTGPNHLFGTFCVEIPRNVYLGSTYNFTPLSIAALPTSLNPAMGELKAAQIRALWAQWRGTLDTGTAGQIAAKYAAFQLAIWEIEYERASTFRVGTGNFRATNTAANPTITGLANTFLTSLDGYNQFDNGQLHNGSGQSLALANLIGLKLTTLGGGDAQDQIAEVHPTPAPASLVLALFGAVPILAVRRLRARLLGA